MWSRKNNWYVPLISPREIFERSVMKQIIKMIGDASHILHKEYELMPSGRRYRLSTYKLIIPLSNTLSNRKLFVCVGEGMCEMSLVCV